MLLGHRLPESEWQDVDELFAMQNAADVLIVEDLRRARQPERCTADDDVLSASCAGAGQDLLTARDEFVEQPGQFVPGVCGGHRRGRGSGHRNRFGHNGLRNRSSGAMAGGIQTAECLVE